MSLEEALDDFFSLPLPTRFFRPLDIVPDPAAAEAADDEATDEAARLELDTLSFS